MVQAWTRSSHFKHCYFLYQQRTAFVNLESESGLDVGFAFILQLRACGSSVISIFLYYSVLSGFVFILRPSLDAAFCFRQIKSLNNVYLMYDALNQLNSTGYYLMRLV